MTASELGGVLGETPANCSWHLRQLAKHRFVEETGDGLGRRRPWRVSHVGLMWDEHAEDSPGSRAAGQALAAQLVDREVERWRRNLAAGQGNWGGLGVSETVALLTEEEAEAFSADLNELVRRHHGRLTGDEAVPGDARHVHVLALTSVDPR
jgi:hypothetical protein